MTLHRKLRIAMLTHSTNPRGGVAHAMELADAMNGLGHDAVLFAPGAKPFFRQSRGRSVVIPITPANGCLREQVRRRIDDYVAWLSRPGAEKFDIYHAQDGISGNALADLTTTGVIPGYVRTVHHLDDFGDELLAQWDLRSIQAARQVLCVSDLWRNALRQRHGVHGRIVGNGVDRERFTPRPDSRENDVRQTLGLKGGPVFLSVGGVEARKNTLGALKGFLEMRRLHPSAQLVIAGGASLLDHSAYQTAFLAFLEASGASTGPGGSVILAGTIADDAMPALYRTADALVFPSLKEGFGLAALEAMASGVPAIVSRIAPFTEYLGEGECLWVDPNDPASIARAMAQALEPETRRRLIAAGLTAAKRFPWSATARHCLEIYQSLNSGELVHA
jgi:glycosyltransferase-like protein